MVKNRFQIDLGQGDLVDVTIDLGREVTLKEFTHDVRSQEWVEFGDTAIRTAYIKRITRLPINEPDNPPPSNLRPKVEMA